jgi:hypothetical protein
MHRPPRPIQLMLPLALGLAGIVGACTQPAATPVPAASPSGMMEESPSPSAMMEESPSPSAMMEESPSS